MFFIQSEMQNIWTECYEYAALFGYRLIFR